MSRHFLPALGQSTGSWTALVCRRKLSIPSDRLVGERYLCLRAKGKATFQTNAYSAEKGSAKGTSPSVTGVSFEGSLVLMNNKIVKAFYSLLSKTVFEMMLMLVMTIVSRLRYCFCLSSSLWMCWIHYCLHFLYVCFANPRLLDKSNKAWSIVLFSAVLLWVLKVHLVGFRMSRWDKGGQWRFGR